jgi:putative ABC transport system permease protein
MSLLSRFSNLFRRGRLDRELDEELAAHLEEAAERGRPASDVRRAFGSSLQHREHSRDLKLLPWLDALAADVVFGWRQLNKRRAASLAAVLSLGLAIGATTAVYRLVEALLLRPLPIAAPESFFYIANTYTDRDGRPDTRDEFDYPTFRKYRDSVANLADVMVVGIAGRPIEVQIGAEPERARKQYLSGNVFQAFGLRPALGRLLTPDDDRTRGGHPVAVLSFDYWTRRFGADPAIMGKPFRIGGERYDIIGVAPRGFTGTEPGVVTDLFLPSMQNAQAIESPGWSWFRAWVRPRPGVSPEQVRQVLHAQFANERRESVKFYHSDTPKQVIENVLNERLILLPAANGASYLQKEYRQPLAILGVLVVLVLLIACANVGNLMSAQASARAREMALRVSIGAGRMRLVQLVMVESAMLSILGSAAGIVFAQVSAPWIVSILRVPQDPVRFVFDVGWRAWTFNVGLALAVTLLFGLAPAIRASAVQPISALKGGADPQARRRMTHVLLASQMAFCVLVQFVAGLFVATFDRLSNRPLGFSHDRVLILSSSTRSKERPPEEWMQVAAQLRETPGVEAVSLAGWPLLSGNRWTGNVRRPGRPVEARPPYFLDVSPGFFETMRITMLDGRDFRQGDLQPRMEGKTQPAPGVGIVNEAFVRTYFDGQSPVGRFVDVLVGKDVAAGMEIVGVVRDTPYGNLREDIRPTVFLPQAKRSSNSIIVRTAGPPKAMAQILRAKLPELRSDYYVRTIEFQTEQVRYHLLRERVLAALSLFFAAVALVLAAVGLYGVLNYSVTQQRREIGIRMALGARAGHVVRRVTARSVAIVCVGLALGLAGGLAGARVVQSLLFGVKPTDWDAIALPALTLLAAAVAAAVPPAIRAARIDPARTLRSE